MKKILFQVEFRVHLTPDHPKAGEFGFGKLIIWMYGYDQESVAGKAAKIAAFLPYELGAGKSFPFDWNGKLEHHEVVCAQSAEIIGFNIALLHWPKDADEQKVFGSWPYLVPPIHVE